MAENSKNKSHGSSSDCSFTEHNRAGSRSGSQAGPHEKSQGGSSSQHGSSHHGMSKEDAGRLGGEAPHRCRGNECKESSHKDSSHSSSRSKQ